MLHGYLSRVYTDLLSLSVSAEMAREITFSCSPSLGITLLYLLLEPTAFRRMRQCSSLWPSRTNPWARSDFSTDCDIGRGANTQALPDDHPDSLEQKCQARILLYEILITCKDFPFNFSLFVFNQAILAWQPKANWVLIKTGMKMKCQSVPLFYINVEKKKKRKKNPFLINWIEDESSVTLKLKKEQSHASSSEKCCKDTCRGVSRKTATPPSPPSMKPSACLPQVKLLTPV